MRVHADCIQFAWDSPSAQAYHPGQGPLPGGLYEIDSDSQLATLTTIRGDWIFQFEGHIGKDPAYDERRKTIISRGTDAKSTAESAKVEDAPVVKLSDMRHQPMSAKHKADMVKTRAANKLARQMRIEAETATA